MNIETIYLKTKPRDYHAEGFKYGLIVETIIVFGLLALGNILFFKRFPEMIIFCINIGVPLTIINIATAIIIYPLIMKYKEVKK